MYAALVTVDGADRALGPDFLSEQVIPRAKQAGARAGVWLYLGGGVGTSVVSFDDEAAAKAFGDRLTAGGPVMPDQADSPTVRSVQVCEVVAFF